MHKPLDPFIHTLANLPSARWRRISHTMTWYFRDTPGRPRLPVILDRFMETEPMTPAIWLTIRTRTNRERQRLAKAAKREVKRKRQARKTTYMREYMRDYRAKQS